LTSDSCSYIHGKTRKENGYEIHQEFYLDRGDGTSCHHMPRNHLYRVGTMMSDLRIKPNQDNGDLPKKSDGGKKHWKDTVSARSDEFRLQLRDLFNPALLREKLEKDNGQK